MSVERMTNIPTVTPDKVRDGASHTCPFAKGFMFRWHCGIMWERTTGVKGGIKDRNVQCPEEHMNGKLSSAAPSECPFRSGQVIVYDVITVEREQPIDDARKVGTRI